MKDSRRLRSSTPGHEAFTLMRARGARVTDIVVLVVAADDAASCRRRSNRFRTQGPPRFRLWSQSTRSTNRVNPEREARTRRAGPACEDWGGDTVVVEIGKDRQNLNAARNDPAFADWNLKADPAFRDGYRSSQIDKGRGNVATVLVQNGTLKVGDNVNCALFTEKVRAMFDEHAQLVKRDLNTRRSIGTPGTANGRRFLSRASPMTTRPARWRPIVRKSCATLHWPKHRD
jgi:translation initiation factor IF-2